VPVATAQILLGSLLFFVSYTAWMYRRINGVKDGYEKQWQKIREDHARQIREMRLDHSADIAILQKQFADMQRTYGTLEARIASVQGRTEAALSAVERDIRDLQYDVKLLRR